ncbi:MAG: hypothetical protein DRJ44_05175 [Thermoprotei archaeon]|nr:MAG: hypothetical protein DRJ44_05175 [Thermoprotei archaeon]
MGQYKHSLLEHYNWLREKTNKLKTLEEIIQHVENPEQINLEKLEHKLDLPREIIAKTIERLYGPKTQVSHKLYHWWQEPYGAKRKISASYLHTRISEAMKKIGAENPTQLAKKLNIPEGKTSIIRDWMKQYPTITAKTGVLKRILTILNIPLEELEQKKAILDRKFPINLYSPKIAKLYTHALNEGSLILGKTPTQVTLRYVNQDPVLIRKFIDTVKKAGGWAKILPPQKPGFDVYTDSVTARIVNAAGLPYGRKTITDPPLHPRILKDPQLAKHHLHITFLEEGYATFSYAKDRLQLIIGISRSKDITEHIPAETLQELLKYKGQKVQPTKFFTKQFIDDIFPDLTPIALTQERRLIEDFLWKEFSMKLEPKARVSYLHISLDGDITANYRIAVRSEEAIQLFKEIVFAEPLGTWKEYRLQKMLEIYDEYKGRRLTPEEKQEIKQQTPPSHIPEKWIITKARQLLANEAPWINDEQKIKIITRWYKSRYENE